MELRGGCRAEKNEDDGPSAEPRRRNLFIRGRWPSPPSQLTSGKIGKPWYFFIFFSVTSLSTSLFIHGFCMTFTMQGLGDPATHKVWVLFPRCLHAGPFHMHSPWPFSSQAHIPWVPLPKGICSQLTITSFQTQCLPITP